MNWKKAYVSFLHSLYQPGATYIFVLFFCHLFLPSFFTPLLAILFTSIILVCLLPCGKGVTATFSCHLSPRLRTGHASSGGLYAKQALLGLVLSRFYFWERDFLSGSLFFSPFAQAFRSGYNFGRRCRGGQGNYMTMKSEHAGWFIGNQ